MAEAGATTYTPIAVGETAGYRPVDSFSCLRIGNPASYEQVRERVDALRAEDPAHQYLFTLDELDQCLYTSGHAGDGDERLARDWTVDLDWDDPVQVAGHELAVLEHRVRVLAAATDSQAWSDALGELVLDADDVAALARVNADPSLVLDDVVYVQRVPVARPDLLLAALPNGYFSGDLDTFDNHAVARRLASEHGYRYAAMGAQWLAFERSAPATAEQARAVVADLAELYAVDRVWDPLERAITGATHLLLGYTERFEEMLD